MNPLPVKKDTKALETLPEEIDLDFLGILKLKATNLTPATKKFIFAILVLLIALVLVAALCWPKGSSLILIAKTLAKLRNIGRVFRPLSHD